MSFKCVTRLECDICGSTLSTSGVRMSDCASKQKLEICSKERGWKVVYKHHVCKECAEHYGMKYLKAKFKEEI